MSFGPIGKAVKKVVQEIEGTKGKTPAQYVDDDEAASFLYEEGLEFQTNYNVNEDKVRNSVRRLDPIVEQLNKRRAEEAKKKS